MRLHREYEAKEILIMKQRQLHPTTMIPDVWATLRWSGVIAIALGFATLVAMIPQAQAQSNEALNQAASTGTLRINGRYGLRELIDLALTHNPELAAGVFDGQAAAARTRGAEAASYPRLTIEGGYTYYGDDLRLVGARFNGELGAFGSQILTADLVMRVPLYTGGRLVAELQAAQLLEAASSHRLSRSKSDLIFNVSSLYYAELAQNRLIEALTVSSDLLASQLQRVQALVNERKAAKVDALRAEVKLADIRQRLLREKNSLGILRRALLNVLGDEAGEFQITLVDALQTPMLDARPVSVLVRDALAHRPDMAAVHTELDAQSARIVAARAGNASAVNLLLAGGVRKLYGISQQPVGIDSQDPTYRIGLTFEMPLFDAGRTAARVAEETAKLAAQRARLDKLSLQVRLEVETAHASLTSALERLASTEQLTQLAAENLCIEQEKYALTRGILLDVLDAQSALTEAQATHIRALADANTAAAQLAWASAENLL